MRKLALVTALILITQNSIQAKGLPKPTRADIYFENDSKFLRLINPENSTDRHYTNGVKISLSYCTSDDLIAKFFDSNSFTQNKELETAYTIFVGHSIYTPDHIGTPALRSDKDMAFAGWLYGGISFQRAAKADQDDKDDYENFEFSMGVIGPSSKAAEIQRGIHQIFFAPTPQGWENQLGDELAFDFTYRRKWKNVLNKAGDTNIVDIIPQLGFTVGTVHRHANAGIIGRFGWNLPDDFGPGSIEDTTSATGVTSEGFGIYTFARGGVKAVEHNRFLTGLQPEPFLFDAQLGVALHLWRVDLSYSQTFKSHEFKGQDGRDNFSAVTLSANLQF